MRHLIGAGWMLACIGGCGVDRGVATDPAARESEPPRATPDVARGDRPEHADADRFACRTDDDCVNDCQLGAISLRWVSALAPRAPCEDGCAGRSIGPPGCRERRCVARDRAGAPVAECTALDVPVVAAPRMRVELEGRLTELSDYDPAPDVGLHLRNPTSDVQRVQLYAVEVWRLREGGEVALPLAPQAIELRSPDGARERAAWLEFIAIPPGASREAAIFFEGLGDPRGIREFRLRITLRDDQGGMSAVEARLVRRHRSKRRVGF